MDKKKAFMTFSDRALDRIQSLIKGKPLEKAALRIGVKRRGCNGLSYVLNYTDPQKLEKFDEVIDYGDLRVIVDNKALMALVGTRMDYVEDELKSEFIFENPNSKGECGCGESFHI